jgi:hypothetical protein
VAANTGEAGVSAGAEAHWRVLVRPRWLAWHAFVVLGTAGMLYLGAWQLHRAESGNELSWAYTFEWPLFAIFGIYFWIKSLRDELRPATSTRIEPTRAKAPDIARATPADGDAYTARLKAEVREHGRWHGWR